MTNYHIKRTSTVGSGVGDVYYKDGDVWTETYADRKVYTNKTTATNQKNTTITLNGVTYAPKVWSSSTVITE